MADDEYIIEQLEGVIDILNFIVKSKQNDKIKDAIQKQVGDISQQQDLKLKDPYYNNKLTKLEGKYGLLKIENEELKTENEKLKEANKLLEEKIERQKVIFFPWHEYEYNYPFKTPDTGCRVWF